MYLHKTKNGHYTPPCCYFSGELEVVELRQPHAALRHICGRGWYSNKEVLDQQMKSDAANGEESVEETSTSMQAKVKRFVKNHGYYSLPKFFRAHLYFIYRYYFRLGFLDGTEGKIYTFLQAYWYRYLVDAKQTIEKQYCNREKIWERTDILPEYDLRVVKAVQTIAGTKDERFNSWFDALDYMYNEVITLKTPQKQMLVCNDDIEEGVELDQSFLIGIVLFVVGIIPTYMNYSQQIKYIMSGNMYAGVRETVDLGPIGLLANFYQVGIFLMLIGSKNHKTRAKVILLLAVAFEAFCMLSGNRSSQILKIIALLFIYYRIIQKITPKKIVAFTIVGYFVVIILYFISAYRNANIADLSLLKSRFIEVATGEPLLELLAQLGSNLNVVALTLVSIPTYNNFNFGLTYVVSWCAIYPNTGGLLGNIPNMYAFLNYLDTKLPLGGSYIGELYFNFGWFGILFAIFIGMFVGWTSAKVESAIVQKKWIQLGPYMVLFYSLLWWVRDYFSGWIFRTVWCAIAVWLINKFLKNRRITRVTLGRR